MAGPGPAAAPEPERRAAVIGTGLIGASIGLALRARGWHVCGADADPAVAERAAAAGALDEVGPDPDAAVTFVATPVGQVVGVAQEMLSATSGVVTDVGSVKAPIVDALAHPRFVGGHPMAGSEQEGVDGATASLFEGAVWVLTPVTETDPAAYATLHGVVSSLGAEVVAVPPDRHDALVAMVSHVPHLTAVTLMQLADERSEEHRALLRLAAGGFRDMTRIAAGHPGIWPDICSENREAIVETLDRLIGSLGEIREVVARRDRDGLLLALERARSARLNLPTTAARPEELAEVRVPVLDREGELATITTTATDLDVNIFDIEIAHSAEGPRGVVILLVSADAAGRLREGLAARGYSAGVRGLA